ncbi:MAG TPA: LCP family protein [Acidothermaceae bacterium]|jgi:LCP family protein required for cell wall assembly
MAPRLGRPKVLDPAGEQTAYEHAQRRLRIIGRLIVGFFALIVLAGGIGGVAYQKIFSKVDYGKPLALVLPAAERPAKAVPKPNATTGAATTSGTAKNILILGVDSRLGENAQFQVKGAPAQTEDLSDTAILAHLSADGKNVTLVSIPRDSVVQIPSCEKVDNDGNPILSSTGQLQYSKPTKALFNQAIELGGPYCSAKTLEGLTGVRIDNFLEIDFTGVVKMSKAIGGVPLNICEAIHDSNTGLNLTAGPVNLIGDQALAFVRARYGLTGGDDLHRIQRQQQFMASMVRKALSSANFFNPATMYNFYSAVAGSLSTDMTSSQLLSLGLNYRHINTSNIIFTTVPTYPAPKGDPFYQHLYWSVDEANALFADIHDDIPIPVSTGTNVGDITLPRSAVTVEVLNGTSTDGLARQVRDALTTAGFDVVSIGTATNSPVAKTTVSYVASHTTSMQTLAGALTHTPQEVLDSSAGANIVLTLGADWAGVSTTAPASSSAPASASPSAIPGVKATSATTNNCVQG